MQFLKNLKKIQERQPFYYFYIDLSLLEFFGRKYPYLIFLRDTSLSFMERLVTQKLLMFLSSNLLVSLFLGI